MSYDKTTKQAELDKLDTKALLALHNRLTGKTTKKFASRAKGIAQTLKALAEVEPKSAKKANKKNGEPRKKPGMTFKMRPMDEENKTPRDGSKRAVVYGMLSRKTGALFSEICEKNEWNDKDGYEGIRLLNVFSGFGLWDTRIEKDGVVVDYRIRIVGLAEFDELTEKENAKE